MVVRESLWLVDNACLSVIGVSAGAELSARDLRGDARKIIVWTISIALFTWMTVFTAFTVGKVSDRVEFLEDMNRNDFDDGHKTTILLFTAAAKVLASVRGRIVNSYVIDRSESSFGDRRFERNRSERTVFKIGRLGDGFEGRFGRRFVRFEHGND